MFDIGFTEVTLIAVIGLLVIGPERLPRVAREIGLWVGRLRRYVAQVRADIEREVRADEIRELVNKPAQELKQAIKDTEKTIKEEEKKLEKDLSPESGTADAAPKSSGASGKGDAAAASADAPATPAAGAAATEAGSAASATPESAAKAPDPGPDSGAEAERREGNEPDPVEEAVTAPQDAAAEAGERVEAPSQTADDETRSAAVARETG